jgi:hypothetical protein
MEPIVASLEVDEFLTGGLRGAATWPTGTLVEIWRVRNAAGMEVMRPDGRKKIYAKPIGFAERNGVVIAGRTNMYTLHGTPSGNRRMIGRYVQPPNTDKAVRGTHNVIHFTPRVTADDEPPLIILADPITVNGPGDEQRTVSMYNVRDPTTPIKIESCGPKFLSATVGGVTAFDWPVAEYRNTVKYAPDMDTDAYAGGPVYLESGVVP